jgi:protein-export membrane protein SecD/preprotein translocase SecF subunit
MEQRNINMLIGLVLLTGFLIWVNSVTLDYVASEQPEQPFWAKLLVWQGEQERSIKIHQGLDLQGGLQVVLEADMAAGSTPPEGVMSAARSIIENRVNGLGVTEPLVQLQGDRRIIVELPGIDDPKLAISTIRETGLLEFVDAGSVPIPEGSVIRTTEGDPKGYKPQSLTDTAKTAPLTSTGTVSKPVEVYNPQKIFPTIITGGELAEVSNAGLDPNSRQTSINFSLKPTGGTKFGDYSARSIGKYLCIILDKKVLSCPTVNARIDTNGTITLGRSNLQQGQALAIQLRYGSLPVALNVVENRIIGPTLGQDSVQRSIRAGSIGLIIVLLFMVINYRLPGVMAGLALVLYGLMNFGVYKLMPITMTLPGITGFILSIGMAVDANILVFERMKEELRAGRNLRRALELSFERAWPSIRDSAISTIITCAILFQFGSSFGASIVKGFALTLFLGVIIHLFTALVVTRTLLRFALGLAGEGLQHNSFMIGFNLDTPNHQVPTWVGGLMDIVGRRKLYYTISLVTIIAGLAAMAFSASHFGTPLKLSVDFTSGSLMEVHFDNKVEPAQVRQIFENYSYVDPATNIVTEYKDTEVTTAQQLGKEALLIRSKFLVEEARVALQDKMRKDLGNFEELRFDSVGATIGQEVTQAGMLAVATAAIAILLYLVFAFRSVDHAFRYGVAAVTAMLHDILVTTGIFALCGVFLGWEVDALFLTGILTVIGYSVHDTIIVFDRLRENIPQHRGDDFELISNRSILETMNRSLATSLSTLFVVVAIFAFGGATISQFIAIIMVGIITGTYSSIFNAVPILVSWENGEFARLFGQGKTAA